MTTIDETSAPTAWYRKTTDETAQLLDVDTVGGLTASQVSERQTRYGANELTGKAKDIRVTGDYVCTAPPGDKLKCTRLMGG